MQVRDTHTHRRACWGVAIVATLLLVPWLGLAEFNTKGEPREAVVALSMLKDGNWILPINNGGDIPYKPPMLHWLIALVSMLTGGRVSEFASRLPSAIAAIAMATGFFSFCARRIGQRKALMGAALLLTAFEVHRAATVCRVDMLLTAFTVWAICALYAWHERDWRGWSWGTCLTMGGAALTKGPIGVILPVLVMAVWVLWADRRHWWAAAWRVAVVAMAGCLLPLVWYVAAYRQGGQPFLELVMEENIGRMMGHMSYDSHLHPAWYNLVTLLAGWAPWTLLALLAAGCWLLLRRSTAASSRWKANDMRDSSRRGRAIGAFLWVAPLVILLFYCIPASKRSVYLLPCYPFMAMLLAQMTDWMLRTHRKTFKGFTAFLAVLGIVIAAAIVAVRMGVVPDSMFHGKHAADNIAMLHALADAPMGIGAWVLALLPFVAAVVALGSLRSRRDGLAWGAVVVVVAIYLALDGLLLPRILNTKSTRPVAELLKKDYRGKPLYQHISTPMLHFFGIDYYTDDGLAQFERERPRSGVLVVAQKDLPDLAKAHPSYTFTQKWKSARRMAEPKDTLLIMEFLDRGK